MKDINNNGWTENEIDFSDIQNSSQLWCLKYCDIETETASGTSKTTKYKGVPTNRGRAFKFKVRYNYRWLDKDLTADPVRNVEGMYCNYRYVHVDSEGKIFRIEKQMEELVFETTLHT